MASGAEDYWDTISIAGELASDIAQLNAIIDAITNGTNVSLTTANTKLDNLNNNITNNTNPKLDTLATKTDAITTHLTNTTDAKLETLGTKTDAITTHLTNTTDAKLDTLGTKVDAVATQISGGTNPKLDDTIDQLSDVVTNLATTISSLATILAELELHTDYLAQIAASGFTEWDASISPNDVILSIWADRGTGTIHNVSGDTLYLHQDNDGGAYLGSLAVNDTFVWHGTQAVYNANTPANSANVHCTDSK